MFGLRKAGKTSLLNHLATSLDDFLVVKLDLQRCDPNRYATMVFNEILLQSQRMLRVRGIELEETPRLTDALYGEETAPIFRERMRAVFSGLKDAGKPLPVMIFLDEVLRGSFLKVTIRSRRSVSSTPSSGL